MLTLKIQRSLNDGGKTVLVYDETRCYVRQFPCDKSLGDLFDALQTEKLYVRAKLSNGYLQVLETLEEQDW